jgi:hypothetical protein
VRSATEEFPFFSRVMFLVIWSSVGLDIHRSNGQQVQLLHAGIQETDCIEIGINRTDHGPKWSELEASKTLM